ncbi:MAG: CDP-diacylglycerol--glycerol-3-phosphate 3-phosphatidyltransferase [Candidatus Omnitrophota bacterium]|nr:CDP-diacylglycerol--glycerol-3-phosphate 3-phosphatidyltransferase [Candidatus Omnitrophota bacterium]
MNLPNKLTVSRILLTFVFMVFLYTNGVPAKALALITFLFASLTDALDGYFAKKSGQVTDFGRFMDPIADKILVLSALLAFVEKGIIPAWMVVIIIFREVTVTGLRILGMSKGKVIPSDGGGKYKTALQLLTITVILVFLILKEGGLRGFAFWNAGVEHGYRCAIYLMMLVTVTLTLVSGIRYFIKNKEVC